MRRPDLAVGIEEHEGGLRSRRRRHRDTNDGAAAHSVINSHAVYHASHRPGIARLIGRVAERERAVKRIQLGAYDIWKIQFAVTRFSEARSRANTPPAAIQSWAWAVMAMTCPARPSARSSRNSPDHSGGYRHRWRRTRIPACRAVMMVFGP